jgi:hypothetical protein
MSMKDISEIVEEKYCQAALRVVEGRGNASCGSSPSRAGTCDPITSNLYNADQTGVLPEEAFKAPLGCGNPTGRHS